MGLKPISPSANFTTYRLPTSRRKSDDDIFAAHSYNRPRPKATSSSGLFGFLLCSRPCLHQHSVDADEENHSTADLEEENEHLENRNCGDLEWPLRTELQSVMRHLEVRWQLFNEALSRFGDLEAMLAICADKVKWRHHTSGGVKDVHVREELRSLIERKLSMEVSIRRITQLSSMGKLGISLDQDGHWEQQSFESKGRMQVESALEFFYESLEEFGSQSFTTCVLEEDSYISSNQRGEMVEEGKQAVLWEQSKEHGTFAGV